jgi:hypothetical protein
MGMHLHELSPSQRAELEDVVSYIQLKLSRLTARQQRQRQQAKLLAEDHADRRTMRMEAERTAVRRASPSPSSSSRVGTGVLTRASSTSLDTSEEEPGEVSPRVGSGYDPISPCIRINSRRQRQRRQEEEEREVASFLTEEAVQFAERESTYVHADSTTPSHLPTATRSSVDAGDTGAEGPVFNWERHVAHGTLPPGHDPRHDPMRLNLSEVRFQHRPLAIYAGVLGIGMVAGAYMRWLGFRRCTSGRLSYWYRPAVLTPAELDACIPRSDPLVLIHGIGIGVFTYLHLLRPLCQTLNPGTCVERSIYVLELPYISMRLDADDVPSLMQHVHAIADMLYEHEMGEREAIAAGRIRRRDVCKGSGVPFDIGASSRRLTLDEVQQSADPIKALVVSHSYGTFVSTWLVKYRPDLISSVVLIDPVCFLVSVQTCHACGKRAPSVSSLSRTDGLCTPSSLVLCLRMCF